MIYLSQDYDRFTCKGIYKESEGQMKDEMKNLTAQKDLYFTNLMIII